MKDILEGVETKAFCDALTNCLSSSSCSADVNRELHIQLVSEPLCGVLEEVNTLLPALLVSTRTLYVLLEQCGGQAVDQTRDQSWMGSPLKLQTFHSSSALTDSVPQRCGIPSSQARLLLSQYIAGCRTNTSLQSHPLWVLCDGVDGVAAMSVLTQGDPVQYKTCSIHVTRSDRAGLRAVTPTVDRSSRVDFAACYELGGEGLCADVSWDQEAGPLLHLPPLNARAALLVQMEGCSEAAHSLRSELTALQGFVRGLREGDVEWSGSPQDALTQVKTLLSTDSAPQREEVGGEEDDAVFGQLPRRDGLDFTEQLWCILRGCSSYSDLRVSLHHVLSALHTAHLPPTVHKQNRCQLARLIRQSYSGTVSVPSLTGLTPLLMLAEIGSEKLLRDCSSFLIGEDLVTAHDLEPYLSDLPPPAAGDTGSLIDLEHRLTNLTKLHQCVELVLLLRRHLSLPALTLGACTREVLRHLRTSPVCTDHVYTLPVPAHLISPVIKRVGVVRRWRRRCVARSGEETLHVITSQPGAPHVEVYSSPGDLYLTTITRHTLSL